MLFPGIQLGLMRNRHTCMGRGHTSRLVNDSPGMSHDLLSALSGPSSLHHLLGRQVPRGTPTF